MLGKPREQHVRALVAGRIRHVLEQARRHLGSPRCHDQVTTILRSHGISVPDRTQSGKQPSSQRSSLPPVSTGKAFVLAAPGLARPVAEVALCSASARTFTTRVWMRASFMADL
jgi:hypothetical protein